jgi:glucose-1-phosphate thymidylyltransferase
MSMILFEDDRVDQLHPITISRAAFAINCGSFRLIDRLVEVEADQKSPGLSCVVRPHLRRILIEDFPEISSDAIRPSEGSTLLVNARMVPSAAQIETLREIVRSDRPGIVRGEGRVAAALLGPDTPVPSGEVDLATIGRFLNSLALAPLDCKFKLFEYPHDVIRYHQETLGGNLEARLATGNYREIADGVFLAEEAQLGQYVVTDTTHGPIVLESHARIGPYCYLSGPVHVGPWARVNEHAALKDAVALGHTTKIGGEVEASIIEPYTNKQHHGFMGHSYLGSWINLGAGTCNSDLKNTYGTVNMVYHGKRVASGMQFVGCMVGDYSKTAINTGIFTGKTIGACSMVYGYVTTNVPSFVNYARLFGQVTETPVDVLIATQARMFARRDVPQRDCDVQLLRDMYELTRHERQLAGEPLSL